MGWQGHLQLNYTRDDTGRSPRTIALDRHHGPLRVLQRLYPEGDAVCHHVLVHPPGGIVGGDVLQIDASLAAKTHALITTPGATRYYRSAGEAAMQQLHARVEAGARLEWLPLETIAYHGCIAENRLRFDLAPGAEMFGWDVLALGLPAAGLAWERGSYQQRLELPGVWLEQARIDAADTLLLNSPLGWDGQRVLATCWFAAGSSIERTRREALIEQARTLIDAHPLKQRAGVSAAHDEVIVLRALAPRVEPVMQLLSTVWAAWRQTAWGLAPCAPRVWRT
jgi:urease accessory protein